MKTKATIVFVIATLTFSGFVNALPFNKELKGELAKDVYILADSTDNPGTPGPRTVDITCAYQKVDSTYAMDMCIMNEGFVNPPLNEQVAQFFLENRQPQPLEESIYTIGARANCTADGEVYLCKFEDLENQ